MLVTVIPTLTTTTAAHRIMFLQNVTDIPTTRTTKIQTAQYSIHVNFNRSSVPIIPRLHPIQLISLHVMTMIIVMTVIITVSTIPICHVTVTLKKVEIHQKLRKVSDYMSRVVRTDRQPETQNITIATDEM